MRARATPLGPFFGVYIRIQHSAHSLEQFSGPRGLSDAFQSPVSAPGVSGTLALDIFKQLPGTLTVDRSVYRHDEGLRSRVEVDDTLGE
jgi:hypothetical protein